MPVILDGAQGAGAVPVDVHALGCVAYAAAGQKWLCGADGTGMLYLQPEFGERVRTIAPTYFSFEDASEGLDSSAAGGRAALRQPDRARGPGDLRGGAGGAARPRASTRSSPAPPSWRRRSRARLADAGRTVAQRDHSTLVAFEDPDPEATRGRLLEQGVGVRNLPGYPYLRASVGAWNDESDLERLLAALKT